MTSSIGKPTALTNEQKEQLYKDFVSAMKTQMSQHVARMTPDELRTWRTMSSADRVEQLKAAYGKLAQTRAWPAGVPNFKKTNAQKDTLDSGLGEADERAKPTYADFLAEVDDVFAAGVGGFLFRNMDGKVPPQVVLDQDMFRGRNLPTGVLQTLVDIYTDVRTAAGVITEYTTANVMTAAGTEVPCMSACTDGDNTLGRSPTWQYAFPVPALQPVPLATVQAELGVSAVQAASPATQNWTLMSDTGAVNGAGIVAFVCNGRADEHIFFTTLPIDPQSAYRSYGVFAGDQAHRGRWKLLDTALVAKYWRKAEEYGLQP